MAFWDKKKENEETSQDSSSKYIYRASEELAVQDEAEKKAAEKEDAKKGGKSKSGKSKKRKAKKVRRGITIWQVLPFLFVLLLIAVITIKIVSYVGGISRTPLKGEDYTHAERFANSLKVEGIDVSEHQG